MTKTLKLKPAQLLILLDAMDGIDAVAYYNGDNEEIKAFDLLYQKLFKAYQETTS